MKRFFLLLLSLWKEQLKLYFVAALIGAIIGVLVLAPSYDYINSQTITDNTTSSIDYMSGQFKELLKGNVFQNSLMLFYAEIGAMLGLLTIGIYSFLHRRLLRIERLKMELHKDIPLIIKQGEGPLLEFKSSFRWDIEQSRTNRQLEGVVLKSLAGFLNSNQGGTLLIGVADDGQVIGLKNDFQTLKKQNQDGFEQAIMTAIAANLGADLCSYISILFHVIDTNALCRLIVSPADRPVFLNQGNTLKLYVRTGGGTRDLNIQEALEFAPTRWKRAQ
ncbi:MAG: ATP-binding protein [Methylococcaceae bacterium]|nr:ATP-binding protein [Methylococcaceae bacterium]